MINYQIGHNAEQVAATYLTELGYRIVDLNWRTPVCEIDIVAKNNGIIYFVEVKHRSSQNQGGGLDYITPKKLQQMQFAARCWVQENKWKNAYEISAIEVSGLEFKVTEFLPQIL